MNWYKIIKHAMPLHPDAWQWHTKTHRLMKHQPLIPGVPGVRGPIINKLPDNTELKPLYQGVHATVDSLEVAAVYANNMGSPQDPPVVLQFTTHANPELDIDARDSYFDGTIEMVKSEEEVQRVAMQPYDMEDVKYVMNWLNNGDYDADYAFDDVSDSNDMIMQNARRDHPSVIINYFQEKYRELAPFFFYRDFLMPIFQKKGTMDNNWMGYAINQVRFMSPVHEDQIIAVYAIKPWKDVTNTNKRFDPELEEEDGYQMVSLHSDMGYEFSPESEMVWSGGSPYLFEMPSYYHGTTASRAKMALPQLSSVFDAIISRSQNGAT